MPGQANQCAAIDRSSQLIIIIIFFVQNDYDEEELMFDLISVDVNSIS